MPHFTMVSVAGAAGLAGVSAAGCGFVPGLDPWLVARTHPTSGSDLGKRVG